MSDLKITGVIAGPLSAGSPRAVELTAINSITDLSVYGIASVSDGRGSNGFEVRLSDLPNMPDSLAAGEKIYIADNATDFTNFFGFAPTTTTNVVVVNGNDTIELYDLGPDEPPVIDVFGFADVDGSGEDWDYEDGWAYRNPDAVPSATFNPTDWQFSNNQNGVANPNALAGETNNFTAATPVPIPTVYITESEDSTSISENGIADTYDVVLNSQPTDTVIVTVTPDGQTSLNGAPAGQPVLLTFTPQNFQQVQSVSVSAVDDGNATNNGSRTITHTVVSNDTNYDSTSNSQVVVNTNSNSTGSENEIIPETISTPGVTIIESDGDTIVSEGGGIVDTYEIVLNTAPTEAVTITVTPDTESGLNGGAAGEAIDLIFTSENFSTPQTVTVNAVDDGVFDGEHTSSITHTASSTDTNYNQANGFTIEDVTATVVSPGITITEVTSDPNLEGSTTSYNVVLNTLPTSPVTVTVTPDAQLDLGEGPGEAIELVFDPDANDFSQSQIVMATAVDTDAAGEGDHTGTISHTATSPDTDYAIDAGSAIQVSLDITEPGISIIESNGGTTVSEDGISDQYDIVLNSIPTAAVTVTITPDSQTDLGEGPGTPIEVVFDPDGPNFSQSQTINVTAVDDGEGPRQASITHSAASNDPNYASTSLPNVTPTIIDCFLTGTFLLTDTGETRVEELKIGDRLQTLDGSLEKIKWIGIQTCYTTDKNNHPLRTYPIKVKAGALGANCPIRDLHVSPDHGLLVENILVNAGALENGDSIVQVQPTEDRFVYYHIELERHSILIADGAPAESYLPQKQDRNTFDNGDDYAELYPTSNMQALVPMKYPRVSSKRQLPRFIRKYIAKQEYKEASTANP